MGWPAAKTLWSLLFGLLLTGLFYTAHAQRTATAVAQVVNGFLVGITVTDGGEGYLAVPLITIGGGGGSGAQAHAVVERGAVVEIKISDPGRGYTQSPEIAIAPPDTRPSRLDLILVPQLTIYGKVGATNLIEYTEALGDQTRWVTVTNVVLPSSPFTFFDTMSPPGGAQRYYRATELSEWRPAAPGFVWLPPGQFTMGSPANEQDRNGDEGPRTTVILTRGFYICQHEVTQGEYLAVMGANPSSFKGNTNHPVETVSWSDAIDYCARLTTQEQAAGRIPTGWGYRLPTEAEWEYAARAGTTNRFSFGDDPGYSLLGQFAWYSGNSASTTHAVAGKRPSRWGLYDLNGNVWEWCQDRYSGYRGGTVTDPQGPGTGSDRVLRGGTWAHNGRDCRSAYRAYAPDYRDLLFGFRVVLAPGQ